MCKDYYYNLQGGRKTSFPAGITFGILNNIGIKLVTTLVPKIKLHSRVEELRVTVFLIFLITSFNMGPFMIIRPIKLVEFIFGAGNTGF